jgi:hypothetical protein
LLASKNYCKLYVSVNALVPTDFNRFFDTASWLIKNEATQEWDPDRAIYRDWSIGALEYSSSDAIWPTLPMSR